MSVQPKRESMRLPVLDGIRAFAILGVVVLHVLILSGVLDGGGGAFEVAAWGVLGNVIDVFFIITGFVLFLPVVLREGRFPDLRSYAIGRAARLLPAFWLSLALALLLLAVLPRMGGLPGLGSVALHAGALHTPARLFGELDLGFAINGPVWMISLMVGFYAVLPLIARPYFRHPLFGLALAALITLGWKEAVAAFGPVFGSLNGQSAQIARLIAVDQLPGWAFSFALGMTGAWAWARLARSETGRARVARHAPVAFVAAALVYVGFAYLYGRSAASVNPVVGGSFAREDPLLSIASSASRAALMATVAVGPLWLRRPFQSRPALRLGEVTYGLYLGHFMIALVAGLLLGLPRNGSLATLALWAVVVLPASLLYAEISSRVIERPMQRVARRFERGRGAREPAPTVAEPRSA